MVGWGMVLRNTTSEDKWLTLICRMCHRKFGCFNRTLAEIERICTGCAVFGPEREFHAAQLEAVKEHPYAYEPKAREKLEAYLRGELAAWELRL